MKDETIVALAFFAMMSLVFLGVAAVVMYEDYLISKHNERMFTLLKEGEAKLDWEKMKEKTNENKVKTIR